MTGHGNSILFKASSEIMQTVETLNEGLKRAYTLTITAKDIDKRVDAELKKVAPQVRMPGFRPGKVPANLVRKMHGPSLMQDALNSSIQEGIQQLIADQKIRPAIQPSVSLDDGVSQVARDQLEGARAHVQQPSGGGAGLAEEAGQQDKAGDLPRVLFGHDGGCLWIGAMRQFEVEGVRMVVRFTARSSLLLFCLAFAASSLARLWPAAGTHWLRRNRRYIGVSFAISHGIHAAAIIAFAVMAPALFMEATSPASFVFGSIGYAFIIAMTVTSFDRTAAMLGPRAWRILHTSGIYYLWVQFMISFGMRIPDMPNY
eukprot:gene35093-47158_t